VLGALAVLFKEPPEALAPGTPLTALQCSDLEQRFLELVNMQNFLQQQPYADAPAIRWDLLARALCRQHSSLALSAAMISATIPHKDASNSVYC
jgi:hypothetical protein